MKLIDEDQVNKMVRKAKAARIANPTALEEIAARYLRHKQMSETPWREYAEGDLADLLDFIRNKGEKL